MRAIHFLRRQAPHRLHGAGSAARRAQCTRRQQGSEEVLKVLPAERPIAAGDCKGAAETRLCQEGGQLRAYSGCVCCVTAPRSQCDST
eukprot:5119-Chlamydomonas_euryale.AAC.7